MEKIAEDLQQIVDNLRNVEITDKKQVVQEINGLLKTLKSEADDKYKIHWCIGRLEALSEEL